MIATTNISVDTDEDGFSLVVEYHRHKRTFHISDPEAFYDHVKAAIGPWLQEKYAAKAEFERMKRTGDTRGLSDEDFSAYLDDAYGDDWSKRVGMEQMREQGYA